MGKTSSETTAQQQDTQGDKGIERKAVVHFEISGLHPLIHLGSGSGDFLPFMRERHSNKPVRCLQS
jgi:hypothetical protein